MSAANPGEQPTHEATERIGSALADAGMPRLPARVFAALLVDDDGRMTAAELADVLGASSGGISGAVSYLAPLGMVRRERLRGSRKDVYVVDDDAWHGAMMRHDQVYAPIRNALSTSLSVLAPEAPARHRVQLTLEFLVFLERELDGISARWEKHRAERGL
jgi:DNA-binding transcriptional regulator GbsR (MarR family)